MMGDRRIRVLIAKPGLDDTLIVVGGIIPDDDIPGLKEAGVAEVFRPGASTREIVEFIRAHVRRTS